MKKLFVSLIGLFLIGIVPFNSFSATAQNENVSAVYQTTQDDNSKEISFSDLPDAVQKALKADKYADKSIYKIYEVKKSDGTVYYSVTFNVNGKRATVNFDADGNEK